MKRKFFFHRQNAPMDTDHVVYVVWIGESVREQKILTQLVAWSFAHGSTLRSWTEDVDYYLDLEASRIFPGRGLLDFGLIHKHVTAKELLKLMNENGFEAFEAQPNVTRNFIYQISSMEASKIDKKQGKIKSIKVLSSERTTYSDSQDGLRKVIRFT